MSRWISPWRRTLSRWMFAVLVTGLAAVVPTAPSPVAASAAVAQPAPTAAQPGPAAEQSGWGKPVGFTDPDGSATLFIRQADGGLWRYERGASGRGGSVDLHVAARTDPAVARMLDERPVVFAVNEKGNGLRYQVREIKGWGKWRSLPGPDGVQLDSTPAVVANNDRLAGQEGRGKAANEPVRTDGRLHVFVRGKDGRLWHTRQVWNNQLTWKPWQSRESGLVGNPTAVVGGDGTIGVFARNTAGRVRYRMLKMYPNGAQTWLAGDTLAQELGKGRNDVAVAVNAHPSRGSLFQVFANDTRGRLWTVTQKRQAGTGWTRRMSRPLLTRVRSAPEVAVGADGRLVVFAVTGAAGKLRLRGQTRSAQPQLGRAFQNGKWAARCCSSAKMGGDPSISGMTVLVGKQSRLEVFAVDRQHNLRHLSQLAVGPESKPEGWWLTWANLNPVNDVCTNAGTLECFTIGSAADDGKILDVDADGKLIIAPASGAGSQQWRADSISGGAFRIQNRDTGRCLTTTYRPDAFLPADTQVCSNQQSHWWYLVPVMPGDTYDPNSFTASQFHIASAERPSSPSCLVSSRRPTGEEVMGTLNCTDPLLRQAPGMIWTVGRDGESAPGTTDLAVEYAAHQCDELETGTCSFKVAQSEDIITAVGCVGSAVAYNPPNAKSDFPYTVKWWRMTGTELTVGRSASLGLDPGNILGLVVSFHEEQTWVEHTSEEEQPTIQVPPGRYGWMEIRPLMRRTTGHWSMSTPAGTWTIPGENISFVDDARVVSQIIKAVYSLSPPTQEKCPHELNPVTPPAAG